MCLMQKFTLCKGCYGCWSCHVDQPLAQAPEARTREPILHNTP